MYGFVLQAPGGGLWPHTALAYDQLDTGLLDELLLEFFHAHAGGRADGHHLEAAVFFLLDDWASVEDSTATKVNRQLAAQLDEAAVGDVTAGYQLAGKVNHIADVEVGQIFVADRGIDDLFHSTTPSCERMS
ncbi:hypothetical protein D3C78_1454010 [compost metagenome]